MHNSKALFQEFLKEIASNENIEELRSIAYLVFENLFGLSKTDILADRQVTVTADAINSLALIAQRIKKEEPIQYILGIAEFLGRRFFVDNNVLIPRPETEELVMLIKQHIVAKNNTDVTRIMDIGTGSGCIPITLALEIKQTNVFASDVSEGALAIAKKNATTLKANVTFFKHDILGDEIPEQNLDVVVSNPPYITLQEKTSMMANVLDFEPHLALFVPNDDPLLFYKAIGLKAKKALKPNGILFVEINMQYGKAVANLFSDFGYTDIGIFKDISGKERIVRGISQ
jgi:release factor glutamine methyltransferase